MSIGFLLLRVVESIDHGFDWQSDGWLPSGVTIVDSDWVIAPSEDAPELSDLARDDTTTTVTVTADATHAGKTYQLVNTVADSNGKIGTRAITLRVGWP